MPSKTASFHGAITALVTPMRGGQVDYPALTRVVEEQIAAGIDGLVAVGTTGESATLTVSEHVAVIKHVVDVAAHRVPVIAGAGANATAEAIELSQASEAAGADALLHVTPYYNKPSQEGLFRHFAAIAEATALQLVLYNIPGRCAVDIAADTVVRLAEKYPNIVAIKEASGSVDRVSELVRRAPDGFTLLSGDDSLTLPFLSVGAVGVVSVVSNLFPKEISQFVSLFLEGRAEEARRIHARFYPLFKDLFCEPNPVPVKTALAWRGAMASDVRLPLCEMTAANAARLRGTIEALERELG